MVQNLKVDIIYHSTASDFEMEFNLCGCCRMRLLNDKTSDKKSFVKALARDVARSRIIIACGPLFGADGLISTVATAIGGTTSVCDNNLYGINGDEKIHIISGSTPLVTPDGYFGGCIIESGPQTIILLTENKAFRKNIMQNLIHPYIEEISYIPTNSLPTITAPQDEPVVEFEAEITEQQNYLTTPDDHKAQPIDKADALPITQNEHNIDFIMDDEAEDTNKVDKAQISKTSSSFNDAYNIMCTKVENSDDINSRCSEHNKPLDNDNVFVSAPYNDEQETRGKKENSIRAMDIAIIILILLLLLAILALVYFVVLKPMTMGISTGDYIKEIFGLASHNTLV